MGDGPILPKNAVKYDVKRIVNFWRENKYSVVCEADLGFRYCCCIAVLRPR